MTYHGWHRSNYGRFFIAFSVVLLYAAAATAQGTFVGAQGTGGGAQFVTWLMTNLLDVIFGLAIIFAGIMLLRGHGEWMAIGMMAAGVMIAEHWQDILAALKGA